MSLKDRQLKAAGLLARGLPVRKAAEKLGVSKSAVASWKKLPGFAEAVADCRKSARAGAVKAVGEQVGESVGDLVGQLDRLKFKSLSAIEAILDNDDEPARIKIAAAKIAGCWSGLESQESRIESQLDSLQKKMSPEAYHALILALAEDSPASAGNPRLN